jgi:uncharacterized protein YndB with AHSA1/START domain
MKKALIGLVVLILGFVAFVATRASSFHIERSTEIAAAPDVPFSMVNDLHQWSAWSPWEKLDPAMKRSFDGPAAGNGSSYSWIGNDKVGEGKMTITDVTPPEKIAIKLEFIKPWTATNQVTFTFAGAGDKTKVAWAMDGHNDFMGKAFGLFMNMDQVVGKDFEAGLAQLKTASEAEAEKRRAEAQKAQAQAAEPPEPEAAPTPAKKK